MYIKHLRISHGVMEDGVHGQGASRRCSQGACGRGRQGLLAGDQGNDPIEVARIGADLGNRFACSNISLGRLSRTTCLPFFGLFQHKKNKPCRREFYPTFKKGNNNKKV